MKKSEKKSERKKVKKVKKKKSEKEFFLKWTIRRKIWKIEEENANKWKSERKKVVPECPIWSTMVQHAKIDSNGDWHRSPWSCLSILLTTTKKADHAVIFQDLLEPKKITKKKVNSKT